MGWKLGIPRVASLSLGNPWLILIRFQVDTNIGAAVYWGMARLPRIDADLVAEAQRVVAQTRDLQTLRMAQAVLLPAVVHLTLDQTAGVLGVSRMSVVRLQRRFRQRVQPEAPPRPAWGGRRRALMTPEEERAFLARWEPQAQRGELVAGAAMREALEQHLGRPVRPSVFYRLLERHDWRKVAPDTRHPKADPEVQEMWKKKSCRKSWRPC